MLSRKFTTSGYTLIELIVFIVVIGVTLTGTLISLNTISEKSPTSNYQIKAVSYAQERMELILGQRRLKSFSTFTDPCAGASPPSICSNPTGYTISAAINATTINGDSNYKTIIVTVTGLGNATLTTIVGS